MRVLLEFEQFLPIDFKFTVGLIRIRVLLEGESYLRIYGNFWGTLKLQYKIGKKGKIFLNFEGFDYLLRVTKSTRITVHQVSQYFG